MRLNINIDHVATVRQARRAPEPSVVAAAVACEAAGADGITIHLRQDRRHIQDRDLFLLKECVTTYLNVEMAATDEMMDLAIQARPDTVTLVAENPNEITTEGGLDVSANLESVRAGINRLRESGIYTSIFIDPEAAQIEAAHSCGAQQVELCTALYAEANLRSAESYAEREERAQFELNRLREAATLAAQYGLKVAAGHGLTYRNVGGIAAIPEVTELNIGHNIIAHSIFAGLHEAVREMRERIRSAR